MVSKKKIFKTSEQEVLHLVPNWTDFLGKNQKFLESRVSIIAQGGTIDAIKDQANRLIPSLHPITIEKTRNCLAAQMVKMFEKYHTQMELLEDLYPWSQSHAQNVNIPWRKLKLSFASRISSFDSSQELSSHFIAAMIYSMKILETTDVLILTQGTDSLVNKAALFSAILSPYLFASHKIIILF